MTESTASAVEGGAAARLHVRGVAKAFGAAVALKDAALTVRAGEIHALLGHNGAGKSTLMRIVVGLERPDSGALTLDGAPYAPANALEARSAGVVLVPQERTLCAALTVAENVALGIEPGRLGVVDRGARDALVARALTAATGRPDRIVAEARAGDLSAAEQQLVEIARALAQAEVAGAAGARRARVLVLDEPTSSLGRDDAARLFERLAAFAREGLAVVLVTHFLGDVMRHADRFTVLRDGATVATGDAKQTSLEALAQELVGPTGDDEGDVPPSRDDAGERDGRDEASPAPVSLAGVELHRGAILGIAGLVGAGRTRLLRSLLRAGGGTTLPRGVGLLSEDRGAEGLLLSGSVADNVTLSPRSPWLSRPAWRHARAAHWIDALSVAARGPAQRVRELSGGNQQKVQLARLLEEDFDVLLLDEPTRGVDVTSRRQILTELRRLAARGKCLVVVSSQFDELLEVCDRIAVLRGGKLGAARKASEWTEESLLVEAAS